MSLPDVGSVPPESGRRSRPSEGSHLQQELRQLAPILAPLDKRALGIATGVALAVTVAAATLVSILADPAGHFPLGLLSEFFAGYTVSWRGVPVGAIWGFVTGFVWGWFLAFFRNFVLAAWVLWVRIRADVDSSGDVLDHI